MASVERTRAVIDAMRDAAGAQDMRVVGWMEASATHVGLRDAIKAVLRGRCSTVRLGHYLSEQLGEKSGDLTLTGRYSSHAKQWRYAVTHPDDARIAAEKAAAKRALDAPPLVIAVQAPVVVTEHPMHVPPADYIAAVDRSTGTITRTPMPPAPEERPLTRVEILAAKLRANIAGAVAAADGDTGGFDNPLGIVAANINREHAGSIRYCNVVEGKEPWPERMRWR